MQQAVVSIVLLCLAFWCSAQRFRYSGFSWAQGTPSVLADTPCDAPESLHPLCDDTAKYRTVDGTCNNLDNPRWGAAKYKLRRVVPQAYEVGHEPRGGRPSRLPNPRVISTTFHRDKNVTNTHLTTMFPMFGQFLTHDMVGTLDAVVAYYSSCCLSWFRSDAGRCVSVIAPGTDYFYKSYAHIPYANCFDMDRTMSYCPTKPIIGETREQRNRQTSFIDASQVYGSFQRRCDALKLEANPARLRTGKGHGNLPKVLDYRGDKDPASTPNWTPSAEYAAVMNIRGEFAAGDSRANANPMLTAFHTLFLKEHNRIAKALDKLGAKDDFIYDETRRIIGAELQQITYNEFLPILLGPNTMLDYDLTLPSQMSPDYNKTLEPSIINAFATAAFRFGHSMVSDTVKFMSNDGSLLGSCKFRDSFQNSTYIRQSNWKGYDWILNGLIRGNPQAVDLHLSQDVTNYLNKAFGMEYGQDLASRNIQRGREHGIPGYTTYRKYCKLSNATRWNDTVPEIPAGVWKNLSTVYKTPADIDLFTGGLSESHEPGSLVGPTFNCIIAEQFAALKFGDRFFYTHSNGGGDWTPEQFSEIRKRTLGDIICQNSGLKSTPKNVFLPESPTNPRIPCSDRRRKIDLKQFLTDEDD